MFILDLTKNSGYIVKCADWSVVVQADSAEEACTMSLVSMLESYDKSLKLSSVMITQKINELEHLPDDFTDEDYYVEYHSVSRMLANAGLHELSSNVKYIFGA